MPAVGTQDRCQRCGMRFLLHREVYLCITKGRSSRRCTCQMGHTLSHRCSGASGIQADARPTAKLKTHLAIVFAIMVAVALFPHLSSGELLSSASVQTAEASTPPSRSHQNVPSAAVNGSAVDVLSDTRGVNFSPYLKEVLPAIRGRWIALLPEQARPPTSAIGETDVRFTILPDGSLGPRSMHLDGSTHDIALDRAAWGAVTTSKFLPLPKDSVGWS